MTTAPNFFHQAAIANNGSLNHPSLRELVDPRFQGAAFCLHSDLSGKLGFVCLNSDEKVCKESDLELIGQLKCAESLRGAAVPHGTIGVFIATEDFKLPPKECTKLDEKIFVPAVPSIEGNAGFWRSLTKRVSALHWKTERGHLVAGLFLQPAFNDEDDSLIASLNAILRGLAEGNSGNKAVLNGSSVDAREVGALCDEAETLKLASPKAKQDAPAPPKMDTEADRLLGRLGTEMDSWQKAVDQYRACRRGADLDNSDTPPSKLLKKMEMGSEKASLQTAMEAARKTYMDVELTGSPNAPKPPMMSKEERDEQLKTMMNLMMPMMSMLPMYSSPEQAQQVAAFSQMSASMNLSKQGPKSQVEMNDLRTALNFVLPMLPRHSDKSEKSRSQIKKPEKKERKEKKSEKQKKALEAAFAANPELGKLKQEIGQIRSAVHDLIPLLPQTSILDQADLFADSLNQSRRGWTVPAEWSNASAAPAPAAPEASEGTVKVGGLMSILMPMITDEKSKKTAELVAQWVAEQKRIPDETAEAHATEAVNKMLMEAEFLGHIPPRTLERDDDEDSTVSDGHESDGSFEVIPLPTEKKIE